MRLRLFPYQLIYCGKGRLIMPVSLDVIPEKAANTPRPDTRRWLLFLVFIMLAGIALTFWNWTTERTGFFFWFSTLGLPFCTWGFIFSLRRFAYKAGQVAVESGNVARDKLIECEIRRGQRCAWIFDTYIHTPAGNTAAPMLAAMDQATPLVEFSWPRGNTFPVRHIALTDCQEEMPRELNIAVSKISGRVQALVNVLPLNTVCWLMFDGDSEIAHLAEAQLKRDLCDKTDRVFHLLPDKGLAAFDHWLDKRWEHPGILVAVTLSLPASPGMKDADAITMLVLSNRQMADFPDAVCLHRPEKGEGGTLRKTLTRALLWARIGPEALRGSWFTGAVLTKGSGWNKACEDNGVTFSLTRENHGIDEVLGYAGRAAPWLAITLAAAARDAGYPQVIAAQPTADKDDIWVTVINREEVPEELQRNV